MERAWERVGMRNLSKYMVAAPVSEKADALISRDKKLKKKAARIIPVLTPE
jgi:hypothetical protein